MKSGQPWDSGAHPSLRRADRGSPSEQHQAFDDDPAPHIRAHVAAAADTLCFRPPVVKDWNEYLQWYGFQAMSRGLEETVRGEGGE